MKKMLILALILFSCVEEYKDPSEKHFKDWENVLSAVKKQKPAIKECKKSVDSELTKIPVIYTFEVKENKISDVKRISFKDEKYKEEILEEYSKERELELKAQGELGFTSDSLAKDADQRYEETIKDDNETLPQSFHDCIERALTNSKLSLDKNVKLTGGMLKIIDDHEYLRTLQY